MRKNRGVYFFSSGLLLLTLQLLMYVFNYINGDNYNPDQIIYVAQEVSLGAFLKLYWAAFLGTIVLMVLFVRRLSKGPEAMMVIVGVLLWVIQILGMYDSQVLLKDFIFQNIVPILGMACMSVAACYEAYLIKSEAPKDDNRD